LNKIVETYKELSPAAIHQFGSGTKGYKDEYSDIDIWVTFKDEDFVKIVNRLTSVFKEIAPVIIKHYSKAWSPVGGKSYSIVHEVDKELLVVDYYISKESETTLKDDSKLLYGEERFQRGEWRLNHHINENLKDPHTVRKDIELLLDLIFISYKGIVRKWDDDSFINTLKAVHKAFNERYKNVARRRLTLTFQSNYRLLNDLYKISNNRQKKAIRKIKYYANNLESLY
jgi:hypothetical protein